MHGVCASGVGEARDVCLSVRIIGAWGTQCVADAEEVCAVGGARGVVSVVQGVCRRCERREARAGGAAHVGRVGAVGGLSGVWGARCGAWCARVWADGYCASTHRGVLLSVAFWCVISAFGSVRGAF